MFISKNEGFFYWILTKNQCYINTDVKETVYTTFNNEFTLLSLS